MVGRVERELVYLRFLPLRWGLLRVLRRLPVETHRRRRRLLLPFAQVAQTWIETRSCCF